MMSEPLSSDRRQARKSNPLGYTLSWIRSIFLLDPLIYVFTIILGTLSLLCSLFDRSGRVQHGFARLWSWLILKTILSPVTVSGMENVDPSRAQVFACNHISAMDIPMLYVHLPFQFRIIAKKELFRYPFMGWHLRRSGQIAIDRDSALASMRSLAAAVKTLQAGMPLVVFPEGGRSATGQIQPFMSGAFYVAIKAGVDIVPMAVVGTYEVLPMNSFHIMPHPLELLIGTPIPAAGYGLRDMDVLAAKVQQAVEDLYYSRSRVPDPRRASAVTSGESAGSASR